MSKPNAATITAKPKAASGRGYNGKAQKTGQNEVCTPGAMRSSSMSSLDEGSNTLEALGVGARGVAGDDVEEKKGELASKEEELARIRQQLEEELQTKNQQVKQYKKQVDSYKAELEKCQEELKRLQEQLFQRDGSLEQLRKEKDDLQKSIEVIYHDAETQLSERDQKWQEMVDKTKAHYEELSRQHRETYKKYYVQKYLKWCKVMLGEGQEGVVPPVKSGEEVTLLEVINEYRKRMEGKLCAMEEKYQSAIKAAEEGSKKKQETEKQQGDASASADVGQTPVEKQVKDIEAMCQRRIEEMAKKHAAVLLEKEQLHLVNLAKLKKYYKKEQQEVGARPDSGSCTPDQEVEGKTQQSEEGLRRTKGEKAKLELATRDYRQRLKELQREHEEGLREKMEAHMAELDELKSRYMQKYEALVAKPALVEEEEEQLERGEGSVPSREALQQRVAELSGQLQDKEVSMATVTEHHKEELARLMSHVENQSRAIVELKSSKASLEDVIKQLTEQLEAVGQERSQLEQKAILLGGELKNAKSTAKGSQTLQREVERLREENTSQVNALRAVMKEKEELAGQMELMRAQAQAYKEDFQQERKDREDAHTRSANMEAEHVSREKGLEAELERVKASSLATTQELQARTLQVEELRKQVDTCKAELEMLHSVCVSQEDPGLKQQIEELRIENERLKRSPPHAVSSYTHGKPLQSSGSSVMAREYRNSDHQGPVPSPDYTASREPLSDAPRTSTQQSFSMGVTAPSQRDPPPHVRPSSPHPHGNELFKSHSRQRSNSLGSVKQLGFDLPLQQTSTPHHHPGIIAPLLPLRAVSNHLRTPNQERPAQALLASVPTGHLSGADVSAGVDNDIHHQADVNEPAPMDPNLTCPNCREQFRKGEIQSYKRHVSGCLLRTGSM